MGNLFSWFFFSFHWIFFDFFSLSLSLSFFFHCICTAVHSFKSCTINNQAFLYMFPPSSFFFGNEKHWTERFENQTIYLQPNGDLRLQQLAWILPVKTGSHPKSAPPMDQRTTIHATNNADEQTLSNDHDSSDVHQRSPNMAVNGYKANRTRWRRPNRCQDKHPPRTTTKTHGKNFFFWSVTLQYLWWWDLQEYWL